MSQTYKATGINLKSIPLGEADRLVTILTRELGLIRVVAPGARKQKSKLGGRSGLFVVNQLLLAKGRSLDKIIQAETTESYPGLSQELSKLAASQYLAELVLCHALSEQPQEELYELLNEHLRRLEQLPKITANPSGLSLVLAHLSHGVFHLLALAGIAPQVQLCCITQHTLSPDLTDPNWRVGFSVEAGGTISLVSHESNMKDLPNRTIPNRTIPNRTIPNKVERLTQTTGNTDTDVILPPPPRVNHKLNALELTLLQQLAAAELPQLTTLLKEQLGGWKAAESIDSLWVKLERILRDYAQYHFGRSIRSAALVDALSSVN
ncbi:MULTISPECIES: DNA repair protein RecO [unclassified Moorena]|uniref:DNA repair protein RecO n=1 Tax=unclassified Moorena TaxID=2683338 RepID=UPI0013BB8B9A|nr:MULTISPECIES: DNA repair protein RecO [unclassified Moorena]NEQ13780.1 DNA repair protein RecO [Moorena sp. SIO3E2]NER86891.1 DNA repair protein RecO [Moorena sp. SIO3A2]NES45289.1 DNA repair protein RecO [Moorena sp. SIO2C4]